MNYADTAKAALALMERVELKGSEVQAYILVNQMLGGIAEGELAIKRTEPDEIPHIGNTDIGGKSK